MIIPASTSATMLLPDLLLNTTSGVNVYMAGSFFNFNFNKNNTPSLPLNVFSERLYMYIRNSLSTSAADIICPFERAVFNFADSSTYVIFSSSGILTSIAVTASLFSSDTSICNSSTGPVVTDCTDTILFACMATQKVTMQSNINIFFIELFYCI